MTVSLSARVAEARAALVAADQPVDPLDAAWGAPWQVALLGGEGVGKTTLTNRLSGGASPTGLGGVTTAPRTVSLPGVELFDLPAIGHTAWPGRLVAEVDAAIWLVDGLQPLPTSEADAVRDAGCPRVLDVVVTRLDLVDCTEVQDVLDRVRARLRRFGPRSVAALDPRRDPLPYALLVRDGAGNARQQALARAARDAQARLPRFEIDDALGTWRSTARRAALRLTTESAHAAARWAINESSLDEMVRPPPVRVETPLRSLIGGETQALRERRRAFAAWAAQTELAVRDDLTSRGVPIDAAAQALSALQGTIANSVHREGTRSA